MTSCVFLLYDNSICEAHCCLFPPSHRAYVARSEIPVLNLLPNPITCPYLVLYSQIAHGEVSGILLLQELRENQASLQWHCSVLPAFRGRRRCFFDYSVVVDGPGPCLQKS
jgi:hypothetical protein